MKRQKRKEIYLDNAATTQTDKRVIEAMAKYWSEVYGNPSSFNETGRNARRALDDARERISRILGVKRGEIIFTGSGTESDNLAILGTVKMILRNSAISQYRHGVRARWNNDFKKPHIITSKIEHHAVLRPLEQLEKEGCVVTYLSVNKKGFVDPNEIKKALRPDTVLVSIIYANNEIGTIQPIREISNIIKEERNRRQSAKGRSNAKGYQFLAQDFPYFHIDACQAAGQLNVRPNDLGVDLMTLNGSKIYGPKGIGLLYKKRTSLLSPIILGGGQEMGLRAGTENVPLIIGFAKALELAEKNRERESKRLTKLRDYFFKEVSARMTDVRVNGGIKKRLPNNVNIMIPGIESEALLLMLDEQGVRASAGSACTAYDLEPSHVLRALGMNREQARSSVRFSLGRHTTKKDIEFVVKLLVELVEDIRKIYPRRLRKQYYS